MIQAGNDKRITRRVEKMQQTEAIWPTGNADQDGASEIEGALLNEERGDVD